MQEEVHVHFFSSEFLYKNVHYSSGWYFYDEEEDLYGPFNNKAHAQRALILYVKQLMAGVSPTQIGEAKIIKN